MVRTKFLHSELVCTSRDAIDALLKDSEKELAKLLSASGNTVPFQGVMEQTFTLRREGQRNDSISADSMRSDPIVIRTPASTLSDTDLSNFVEAEHPVEVPASRLKVRGHWMTCRSGGQRASHIEKTQVKHFYSRVHST